MENGDDSFRLEISMSLYILKMQSDEYDMIRNAAAWRTFFYHIYVHNISYGIYVGQFENFVTCITFS